MTVTIFDMFCGAGGSSVGAAAAGMRLVAAANHWDRAVEIHQGHFPDAHHEVADLREADPRRWPRADVLLASPECTNHSQARGVARGRQHPSLFDAPDPSAVRSRTTMWTVPHFVEQLRPAAVVVENVVEATRWVGWRAWHLAMADLGYEHRVLSLNSMHHDVPQSRDRIYVVFWRHGLNPHLTPSQRAYCGRCDRIRDCGQAWKNGRTAGRYRQQWHWACRRCGAVCEPTVPPAAEIIDWSLPAPRIGDRRRPLAPATRARILAGLRRHGWAEPVVTAGAGNVHERSPGSRSRPVTDPLPEQATATSALATPPGLLVQTHHVGDDQTRVRDVGQPTWTVTGSDDRPALVVPLRRHGHPRPVAGALPTVTAAGNHHALVLRPYTPRGGSGHMATPVTDPAPTQTAAGNTSLLVPYNTTAQARTTTEALIDTERLVDDCGFRMLEPHEIAAAMALPPGWIPTTGLTKRDQIRLAGNAVTPPVMTWICTRIRHALETSP